MPRTSEGAQGLFKKPAPASHDRGVATLRLTFPFIAGQWSLQLLGRIGMLPLAPASQSPSLRGSGRFEGDPALHGVRLSCLNPLHCGAVVASYCRRMNG